MKSHARRIVVVSLLLMIGCNSGPKPIMYGNENCEYCSMTIMDDKHASEIVTKKGKVYTFDSIECMLRSLEYHEADAEMILVMDFNNPGTFIEAENAVFLISPDIPSPMGANLSAFTTTESASKTGFSGTVYTWDTIRFHIN